MKRLVLLVLFLVLSQAAWATTYYVATSGDNTRSCSTARKIGTPKQTIANALGCLASGDTLSIASGTYNEGVLLNSSTVPNGTPGAPTKLVATSGKWTVTGCTTDNHSIGTARDYLEISGFIVDGTNCNGFGVGVSIYGSNNYFQDFEIKNTHYAGLDNMVTTATNNRASNGKVHDNGSGTWAPRGQSHCVYIAGPRFILEHVEIYNCVNGHGVHVYSSSGPGNTSGTIIRFNKVHETDSCGIRADSGVANQVYGNVVINASQVTSCAGIIAQDSTNTLIYDNTVDSTRNGHCIWAGSASSGVVIRNNICLRNNSNTIQNDGKATVSNNNTSSATGAVTGN